ncbi:MAG: sensor histidine kinase [Nocardioidaceae bacterium]|nr:sensor histidine kinase [Nocardioidaceae bacterium]
MSTSKRGILAGVDRLEIWLHAAFAVLTVASAIRYVAGHGLGDRAPVVLPVAAVLLLCYAALPRVSWPTLWFAALVLLWLVLVLLAPSFSWCAVPLAFVGLRVLPYRAAVAVISLMTVAVAVAWTSMLDRVDPTVVLGPIAVAGLAVLAYRALERESARQRALLAELSEARSDLAESQHAAGVLAERSRLSRELHDSVAQSLSSINLLLRAAEQDWQSRPESARGHVEQAALTARHGLDDVRRVVRDLAPELGGGPDALGDALRRTGERAVAGGGPEVGVLVHGDPVPVGDAVATAVLRTARGALANVVEHARATRVMMTLTYQEDSVTLDIRDDGIGFDPARTSADGVRGHGLAGIEDRVRTLGGELTVESAPGDGTALAARFPVRAS